MIVSNSSPLIYLAKLKKLELLKDLFKEITIPEEVYLEVVKGKKEKYLDAVRIGNSIEKGWIKVKKIKIIKEIERFSSEIDLGELATINLALHLKAKLVLIDDASARTIAEIFGLNVKGILYVLLKTYEKKLIKRDETKEIINQLLFEGFRISQELYIELMKEIDKN